MLKKIKSLLFTNKTAGQTIVKNTFWLMAGEIIGRLIRAGIVIYSARILGAGEYGIFSYAISVAAFITVFSDIGLSAVLTRETSKNPELRNKYLANSFFLKIILIGLNILFVLFIVPLISKLGGVNQLLPLVAVMIIFESLREFGFGFNRALEKMEREAFVKVILNLSIAILGFVAIFTHPSAYTLLIAYVLGALIGFLATVWFLRAHLRELFGKIDFSFAWHIFKNAWPVGLLTVLGAVMINTDMIMLGWWLDKNPIGYYAAAQKIILLLYIIPTLLSSAAFPAFARLAHAANHERFRTILERTIAFAFLIGIPLAFGGLILSQETITLLYGAEYLPAVATFRTLMATMFVVFPSTIITNALFAYNQQKRFIWYVGLGAISNAFFNYLLIPRFGIEGAAVATLGSQILSNFLIWRAMKKVNYFVIIPRLTRILIAAVLMSIYAYGANKLGVSTLSIILTSIALYAVLLVVFKEPLIRQAQVTLKEEEQKLAG
jgi:O-antigen/teichoic acid export membrane protein